MAMRLFVTLVCIKKRVKKNIGLQTESYIKHNRINLNRVPSNTKKSIYL